MLSSPWSAELRRRCISGSPSSSITVRSSSVSSPVMYNSIFLFNLRFKSRIIRGNRFTTLSIGTIRTFITDSCRLVVTLSRYSIFSLNVEFDDKSAVPSAEETETKAFFAMISSLTRFIKTSNLSISTRTERLATFPFVTGFFGASFFSSFCVTAVASTVFSSCFSSGCSAE